MHNTRYNISIPLMKSPTIIVYLTGIIFSALIIYASFSGYVHRYIITIVHSIGWAYIIDQSLLLMLSLLLLLYVLFRKIIDYYFYAEDSLYLLNPVRNNVEFAPILTGYPFLPFIFSAVVFGRNAYAFNLFSLFLCTGAVLSEYFLLYTISKKNMIATIGTLFFATTPSFLDAFSWQGVIQGNSYTLIVANCMLIFLFLYREKNNLWWYAISLFLFSALMHSSFIRGAGYIFVLFFIAVVEIDRKTYSLKKAVLLFLPYVVVWVPVLVWKMGLGRLQENDSFQSRLLQYGNGLAYYFLQLTIPSQILRKWFVFMRNSDIALFDNLSLTLVLGYSIIGILFIVTLYWIFTVKKTYSYFAIVGMILLVSNIFFIPLFSELAYDTAKLDDLIVRISPPYGPGSRYLMFPAVGFSFLIALLVTYLFRMYSSRKRIYIPLCIAVCWICVLNIRLSISSHNNIVSGEMSNIRKITESIFELVPENTELKILYSTSPRLNPIDSNHGGGRWLYGFYHVNKLEYINDESVLRSYIQDFRVPAHNLYAFYYNSETHAFQDVSELVRTTYIPSEQVKSQPVDLIFQNSKSFTDISTSGTELLYSPVVASSPAYRILLPQLLRVNFHLTSIPKEELERISEQYTHHPSRIMLSKLSCLVNFSPLLVSLSEPSPGKEKEKEMSIIYSCAEPSEWKTQLENPQQLVAGIWRTDIVPYTEKSGVGEMTTSIDCHGTILQNILIVGPAIPVHMEITDASLRNI